MSPSFMCVCSFISEHCLHADTERQEEEEERRRALEWNEENERNKMKTEEDGKHAGTQRCFLILLVQLALPQRLQGRCFYKTKISGTKAAGVCRLHHSPTVGLNYLQRQNFPLFEGQMIN